MAKVMRGLYRVIAVDMLAELIAHSFFFIYAYNYGFKPIEFTYLFIIIFAAPIFPLLLVRCYKVKDSMALGLGLRAAAFFIIIVVASPIQFYASAILHGLAIAFFWVPYNATFMGETKAENRAGHSTQLFALFAIMSSFTPIIGGQIIERSGTYYYNWILGTILLIVSVIIVLLLPLRTSFKVRPLRELDAFKSISGFVFFEGLWQGIIWIAVPIGTISLSESESTYGYVLALLGLCGGVASIIAGRWSDKTANRRSPLIYSSIGVAVFIWLASTSTGNIYLWGATVGLAYFWIYIMSAFTFVIVSELVPHQGVAMTMRELVFCIARAMGGGIVLICLLIFGGIGQSLIAAGFCALGILFFSVKALDGASSR